MSTEVQKNNSRYISKRQNAANQYITCILRVSASSKSKILMIHLLKYLILLLWSCEASSQQLLYPTEIKTQKAWEVLPLKNNCQNTIAWAKSAVAYHSDLYHMLCWCSTSRLQHIFYLHKEYSQRFERRSAKMPRNKVIYESDCPCEPFLGRRNNINIQEKKKCAHSKHQFRCAEYKKM